jgi:hypothetical protein
MSTPAPLDLSIPPFVVVTHVGADTGAEAYTISNEVSGKHFTANAATVEFLEALRTTGSFTRALHATGLPESTAQTLLAQFIRFGVAVVPGTTQRDAAPAVAPLESRAIMIRFDLMDASRVAARFAGLGRFAFGAWGFLVWAVLGAAALTSVALNTDKFALELLQVPQIGWQGFATFAVLFIGLKIFHELGHALAYQEMCRRDGIAPGPIRMGISIFALTPFPYTNVTGAWRLKGRKPRAVIGAGGLYLEFFAVFVATLFWAVTGAGALQTAVFQVAMFATVSSLLFNLNPLIKLDGYYIMSDLSGQPNLAGRGSQAAVARLGRTLGADFPAPRPLPLLYWVLSYLYRWVIFAGIFWLAYQFDPRFAVLVFGLVIAMLIVRPLSRSLTQIRAKGARPGRVAAGALGLAVLVMVSVVPLRDRILLDGHISRYETTFLRVPETAALHLDAQGFPVLESLALSHAQTDLALRQQIVESAHRAVAQGPSAAERARLQTDLAQLADMQENLAGRAARLTLTQPPDTVWTPLAAKTFAGAWVKPDSAPLGALSYPAPAYLVLWLDQRDFEMGLLARTNPDPLTVRFEHDPTCEFKARLVQNEGQLILQGGAVQLRADLADPLPACASQAPSGAGVVARKPATPKSLFQRLQNTVERALQDRLPVETLLEPRQRT